MELMISEIENHVSICVAYCCKTFNEGTHNIAFNIPIPLRSCIKKLDNIYQQGLI